ncbi:MAG: hypothetical protein WAV20_05955 [Blastocatellia bacterium]
MIKYCVALLALALLLSACSGSEQSSGAANSNTSSNASSQVNNNAPQPGPVASNGSTPLSVQPLAPAPLPPPKADDSASKTIDKPAAAASTATNAHAPKLVLPDKKLDFGKQPQGKTLIRAITIKNGGQANLNIESVVPS